MRVEQTRLALSEYVSAMKVLAEFRCVHALCFGLANGVQSFDSEHTRA